MKQQNALRIMAKTHLLVAVFCFLGCEDASRKSNVSVDNTSLVIAELKAAIAASELRNFDKMDKMREELLGVNKVLVGDVKGCTDAITRLENQLAAIKKNSESKPAAVAQTERVQVEVMKPPVQERREPTLQEKARDGGKILIPLDNPVLLPKQ